MSSFEKQSQDKSLAMLENLDNSLAAEPWALLVDTGAATSVAPKSFAPHLELSPAPSTFQLATATGEAIKIFGLRHVHLQCQDLSFKVSFVIADVVTPILGLDTLLEHNLSLNFGHDDSTFLVNTAGKRTQLQQKGEHLYLVACPFQHGLSTCSRGSLPEVIGFLPEDKELHDQELALQSSSSTDLVEDKSFLESLHVHDQSSFVCVLCEEVAVSGGELSDHSLHPFQQPKTPSSQDEQLHNKHPRSTQLRSEEPEEAKGKGASKKKKGLQAKACTCTCQSACVYDLPDSAWHDPALLLRGQLPSQLSGQKNPGKRVTNNLAASKHKMLEESQVDTRAETSIALPTMVSLGSRASFRGRASSFIAMVSQKPVELRQTVASATLAYEESFQETAKELATNSFKAVSPELVPYQLAWQSLILYAQLVVLTAERACGSLLDGSPRQPDEGTPAYSFHCAALLVSSEKLRELTAERACGSLRLHGSIPDCPTRARQLQHYTVQLCSQSAATFRQQIQEQ